METLGYIIIGFAFWALAVYNIWYLFFSKEAIFTFKPKNMAVKTQEERVSAFEMRKRRTELEARRDALQAELEKEWCMEKHRQINILDHHIQVCTERIEGVWKKDNEAEDIQLNKNAMRV